MAQFVAAAHIGAVVVRENVYTNAQQANESNDNIRAQDEDETVPQKKDWLANRPKVKLKIREKRRQRQQFRWKKIKPDYS
jgi:hypothetical protein